MQLTTFTDVDGNLKIRFKENYKGSYYHSHSKINVSAYYIQTPPFLGMIINSVDLKFDIIDRTEVTTVFFAKWWVIYKFRPELRWE